jgi:hypothetical protein
MTKRCYIDVNRRNGKVRGVTYLTDARALDLLSAGFDLRPAGWSISDLMREVANA